jgi:hypothetical protein
MKLFWFDVVSGRELSSVQARTVDLSEAERIWFGEIHGAEGSFLGLTDDAGRTIQFMFDRGLANNEDSLDLLRIIQVDFPCPERSGSFTAMLTGGEVLRWMQDAFEKGADPAQFDGLSFEPW